MSHKPHRRREGELLGNQERLKVEGREVVEIEEQIKERLFIFQVQLLKTYSSRAPPPSPLAPQVYVLHFIVFSSWARQNHLALITTCICVRVLTSHMKIQ